jgi:AraC family transcriptional regulator of adaptative response / DNA-3-methyladenine glycosylase II
MPYTVGMNLNTNTCYQALLTHDVRFDGVFFVGVSTTGIYCRTVCTAKTPRRENCAFYPSAAAAERAGFRPCLRCRPELAPGNARIDAVSRLAADAAGRIEDGALTEMNVAELAAQMRVSDRHLRRVIEREFGVSPVELAQTQRLLLAKRLLTDTDLPITEIAFASGFSSLRRFNALFKARYRRRPTDLRRAAAVPQETLVCEVAYRPPLDWRALVSFLVGRASSGVEAVEGDRYLRTVALDGRRGWIAVTPAKERPALRVELSASLAPALLPTLARVKRLFDLAAHPQQIAAHLGELAAALPGLRVPGAFDGFETAVRTILGQQISVRAATTLAGRFVRAFGEPIDTPFAGLAYLPATAERVARADSQELISLGIIAARANSILALARALTEGKIVLDPRADVERTMARLKEIPGVGEWTAQVIAMRALSWPDAFPHTDLGIYKALGETNPRRVLQIAEAWRPWRAYATLHLWKSLEVIS